MCSGRCPATPTRRGFLAASSAALGAPLLGLMSPQVGAIYDGEAARKRYIQLSRSAADELRLRLELTPTPLHSRQEADAWLAKATEAKPDGLFVVLLDRQQHAWPTANKAIATGIPTVIFSPVGTSFTTNTAAPSRKPGCFIASTDDFGQARYGLKMLAAWARLRATRCLVIKGSKEAEVTLKHLGITLRYIPARTFIDEYRKIARMSSTGRRATSWRRSCSNASRPTRSRWTAWARSGGRRPACRVWPGRG